MLISIFICSNESIRVHSESNAIINGCRYNNMPEIEFEKTRCMKYNAKKKKNEINGTIDKKLMSG